jgi:hypothetical protein
MDDRVGVLTAVSSASTQAVTHLDADDHVGILHRLDFPYDRTATDSL